MSRLQSVCSVMFGLLIAEMVMPFNQYAIAKTTAEAQTNSAVSDEVSEALTYKGWILLKRHIVEPDADKEDWIQMRDIKMDDDGTILKIMNGETETPYSVELVQITHKPTNITVLKLAVYEEGKDLAVSYIWGEPGAKRLGLNLRWVQVGLTLDDKLPKAAS